MIFYVAVLLGASTSLWKGVCEYSIEFLVHNFYTVSRIFKKILVQT